MQYTSFFYLNGHNIFDRKLFYLKPPSLLGLPKLGSLPKRVIPVWKFVTRKSFLINLPVWEGGGGEDLMGHS